MRYIFVFSLFLFSLPLLMACEQDQVSETEPPAVAPAPETPDAEMPDAEISAPEVDDFDYDGLPPGAGREEVFMNCSSCHSLKLVQQQGLSRYRWEEILEWMVEEQGMAALDPPEQAIVINYLVTYYGLPE